MQLKALPSASLSSGELKLYAYPDNMPDTPVGCVELYNYDPVNRRAAVGLIVSNEYRRQGYGTAMIQTLTLFCQHCATLRDWVVRSNHFIDTYRYQLILN